MGTARMGSESGRLGDRREGRCHDVPNLYIVDGSVMVTSAGVNRPRRFKPWRSTSRTG